MRIGEHCEEFLGITVRRGQRIAQIGQAVKMQSTGHPYPGQEANRCCESGTAMRTDKQNEAHHNTDREPDEREPGG
jgi:hypothetical protein